jgi:hypothetical protein
MALKLRIKGRRPLGETREAVDAEWYDDGGAVLRQELVDEADRLVARAAQLRIDAKVVPDQFTADVDDKGKSSHTDSQVLAELDRKRGLLVQQLKIANP